MNLVHNIGTIPQKPVVDKFLLRARDESRLPAKYSLKLEKLAEHWEKNRKPHWINPYPSLDELRRIFRKYGFSSMHLNPVIFLLEECAKEGICPGSFLNEVILFNLNKYKHPKEWLLKNIGFWRNILLVTKKWIDSFTAKGINIGLTNNSPPIDHLVIQLFAKPYVRLPGCEVKNPNKMQFFLIITENLQFKNVVFNDLLCKTVAVILDRSWNYLTYPKLCSLYENLVKIEMGYINGFLQTSMSESLLLLGNSNINGVDPVLSFLEVFAFICQDHDFQKLAEQIHQYYQTLMSPESEIFIEELKKNMENRLEFHWLLQNSILKRKNICVALDFNNISRPYPENKNRNYYGYTSYLNTFLLSYKQSYNFEINNGNSYTQRLAEVLQNYDTNFDFNNVYALLKSALLTGSDNNYPEDVWLLFDKVMDNGKKQELFLKGTGFIPALSEIGQVSFRMLYQEINRCPIESKIFIKKVFFLGTKNTKPAEDRIEENIKEFMQIVNRFKPLFSKQSNSNYSMDQVITFLDNKIQAIEKHLFHSKAPLTSEKRSNLWKQRYIYKKTKEILTNDFDAYLKILLLFSIASFHREILVEALNYIESISPDFRNYSNFLLEYYRLLEKDNFSLSVFDGLPLNFLKDLKIRINLLLINPSINNLLEYAMQDERGWYDILCYFSPTKNSQKPLKIWDAIIHRLFHVKDFERVVYKIQKIYQQPSQSNNKKLKLCLYTVYSPLNYYHKYMAGVCLNPGLKLFQNGKGFLLRLVDLVHKKVVGCILAGFHEFQNKKVLLFYGINPLRSFLSNLSEKFTEQLYLNIRHFMESISLELNLPIYIPLEMSTLSECSNFNELILKMERKYNPIYSEFENFGFHVADSSYCINRVALIIKPSESKSFFAHTQLLSHN